MEFIVAATKKTISQIDAGLINHGCKENSNYDNYDHHGSKINKTNDGKNDIVQKNKEH